MRTVSLYHRHRFPAESSAPSLRLRIKRFIYRRIAVTLLLGGVLLASVPFRSFQANRFQKPGGCCFIFLRVGQDQDIH